VLFNINSHFVLIWKTIFALFNVVIVFLFFFKYFFLSILKQKDPKTDPQIPINIHVCYTIINLTFAFEFLLSIAIIIFNGGSLFTYIKLPLKFIMILPIPLYPDCGYRWLIIFKFARIDLVERLFTIVETICNKAINRFLHNFYIKVFMTYINVLFKYLLIFGLYAHFIGSVFAYYSNNAGYIEIGKAAREMREGLDAEIEKCTDMIKEYQGFIAEYHHALINVPSVEIYHEVMNSIQEYKREIKEVQDDIEFYTKLKQTLITICNLDFLQTSYNGTPSEWELYVVYSY
jgi:hypothetical protein